MALPLPPVSIAEGIEGNWVGDGQYSIDVIDSFRFGPRIFGGATLSILQEAAKQYSQTKGGQSDVLNIQLQFYRLLFPGKASFIFRVVHLGRATSTLHATVSQGGKDCVAGYINMGTLEIPQGLTVKTRWRLEPEPTKASLPAMTLDQDPRWVSYQTPYHPKGFRMVHAYVRFFFPVELQDPSISDQWLRPSDPGTKFTNETLGFISDIGIPMLDNYFPESSSGDHPKVIAACRKQKEDLAKGTVNLDESSGAYETKVLCMSLALSLEIKKQLPPGGVDWLFLRAQAKHIQDDRLSLDATILDEHGDVVALSNQLCQIVDFRRAKRNKQKL